MKTRNLLFSTMILMAVILTACGGATTPDAMMDKPTEEAMMPHETPTADAMMAKETPAADAMMDKPAEEAMMESPAWYSASFTDARTGQAFSIQDLKGKVILVETMAIWCSNCLRQQGQVKELHGLLGERDDFVSIGLDIDPNEDAASLKTYVESNGFDWLYAVPSADTSREIASLYGDQFLNPPSTPILVIDRHGEAHPLPFGIKSAEDLMQTIQPYLDEGM
jgi:cytochrome oxidase Cu insertion factor (SCO1/SenC/PrrC family)